MSPHERVGKLILRSVGHFGEQHTKPFLATLVDHRRDSAAVTAGRDAAGRPLQGDVVLHGVWGDREAFRQLSYRSFPILVSFHDAHAQIERVGSHLPSALDRCEGCTKSASAPL